MKSRSRSLSGAVIAILALPVFMGLLACIPSFPVPIGDSAKSRIDPTITGMWVASDGDETSIYWYIPYDKRTWLLTTYYTELDDENCGPAETESPAETNDPEQADAVEATADTDDVEDEEEFLDYDEIIAFYDEMGSACFEPGLSLIMKAWVTELGGRQYITMEIKNAFEPGSGYEADEWMVHRVDRPNSDVMRLGWLSAENDIFDELDESTATRRKFEKVLRKRGKDIEYSDDEMISYYRVKTEDMDVFTDIIEDIYLW